MNFLTTRQRDLLKKLLTISTPIGAEALAMDLGLTPRQVSYGIKGLRQWLEEREVTLNVTPGVGIELRSTPEQTQTLLQDLTTINQMLLVLTAEERQQLLALVLLVSDGPIFVTDLEELAQVSRSTISKDISLIAGWIEKDNARMIRRQNFGVEIECPERSRQTLIAKLMWGETPFGKAITKISHKRGLTFRLHDEKSMSPLVEFCDYKIQKIDLSPIFAHIAFAEAQLGGRYTDDSVLHLALMLAIQTERVSAGAHVDVSDQEMDWLQALPIWEVANKLVKRLGWKISEFTEEQDTAGIAMHILAAPRNERWPGDLDVDQDFPGLMEDIMDRIAIFYTSPEMKIDRTLQNGIVNHILPACVRQRLKLWMPPLPSDMALSERFETEYKAANIIADIVTHRTNYTLPEPEIINIASLLRAARIRITPYHFDRVIVVCPSGMATAQLLVARLEARFPRLGPLSVVSMRNLEDLVFQDKELIITTVPLDLDLDKRVDILQVHPLLLPEDVERITRHLS